MSALEDLAAQFNADPLPADEWQQVELLQMYEAAARKVVEALPDPYVLSDSTLDDIKSMRGDMKDLASQIAKSVANPSVAVPTDVVRSLIVGSYVTATYQAAMFTPGLRGALIATGKLSAAELEEDLWRRVNVLKAIAALGNSPLLTPLYKQAASSYPVQGFGVAAAAAPAAVPPLVIIAAALISVAAIVALAYTVVSVYLIADTNRTAAKLLRDICFDENGKPYPQTADACIKAALDMQDAAAKHVAEGGPSSIVDKVILYGAIGLGVYATIVFLPDIVKSVRSAKQAATD